MVYHLEILAKPGYTNWLNLVYTQNMNLGAIEAEINQATLFPLGVSG